MDLEINNTNTTKLNLIYIFENNLLLQILFSILIFFIVRLFTAFTFNLYKIYKKILF